MALPLEGELLLQYRLFIGFRFRQQATPTAAATRLDLAIGSDIDNSHSC